MDEKFLLIAGEYHEAHLTGQIDVKVVSGREGDGARVNFLTRSPAIIAKKSEMPLLAGEKRRNKGTA